MSTTTPMTMYVLFAILSYGDEALTVELLHSRARLPPDDSVHCTRCHCVDLLNLCISKLS